MLLLSMYKKNFSVLVQNRTRKMLLNKAISKLGSQRALAEHLSKILARRVVREQIKDWKNAKHQFGWSLYMPISVLRALCKLVNYDLNQVLKHAVKYNPAWSDPNKKSMLVRKGSIQTINTNNSEYLDLSKILPNKTLISKRSMKKLPLFAKVGTHRIKLWSEACWKKSIVRAYRFIKLDELFFSGAAIYAGEGITKTKSKYNESISLGNTEPVIMKNYFDWVNSITHANKISYAIEYNGLATDTSVLIDYWSKIFPNIVEKVYIHNRPHTKSDLLNNYGCLRISIKNTVLKPFILKIVNVAKDLSLTKKEWAIFYLRGLLAAEGSVYSKHRLKAVTIGSINKSERKFIGKLLDFLDLKYSIGKFQLSISNWNSFIKLYQYDALKIPQSNNYSKKGRFITGLKNHATTKKFLDLSNFKNQKFTSNNWKDTCNLKYYNSACRLLNKLIRSNLLTFSKNGNKNVYEINKDILPDLELIWSLKDF